MITMRFAKQCIGFVLILTVSLTLRIPTLHGQESRMANKLSLPEVTEFLRRELIKGGYQPDGLVTQGPTRQALAAFKQKGWQVQDAPELLKRVLPDNDFVAKQFRDEKGRAFLRKIENLPGGIDRVDRLSRIPEGRASVKALIHKVPNGAEWIQAMTTTRRGEILGERLSNAPTGHQFNSPTGRIYLLHDLSTAIHTLMIPTVTRPVGVQVPR
ncbi:MAG: hypothetical protein CMJ80_05565 [Planctomycetaceae bacterium]|nr:hypothetical protein [Planctomycetaceae bacterium]